MIDAEILQLYVLKYNDAAAYERSRAAAPAWGCEARLGARSYEQQDAAMG